MSEQAYLEDILDRLAHIFESTNGRVVEIHIPWGGVFVQGVCHSSTSAALSTNAGT